LVNKHGSIAVHGLLSRLAEFRFGGVGSAVTLDLLFHVEPVMEIISLVMPAEQKTPVLEILATSPATQARGILTGRGSGVHVHPRFILQLLPVSLRREARLFTEDPAEVTGIGEAARPSDLGHRQFVRTERVDRPRHALLM